jgi:hypothetical protein
MNSRECSAPTRSGFRATAALCAPVRTWRRSPPTKMDIGALFNAPTRARRRSSDLSAADDYYSAKSVARAVSEIATTAGFFSRRSAEIA